MGTARTVYIGLGSNLGNSAQIIQEGWNLLGGYDRISPRQLSSPFLSAPVGMDSSYWFTNAAGVLQTSCTPLEFLDILLDTEKRLGRVRDGDKRGYQDRTLDLDLLYFDTEIIDIPRLTVPHPFRGERLFVLAPMAQIGPEWVDPETGLSMQSMHRMLLDKIDGGEVDVQEITKSHWPVGSHE